MARRTQFSPLQSRRRYYGRNRYLLTGSVYAMGDLTNQANAAEDRWYARHGKLARTLRFLFWDFPIKTAVYAVGFYVAVLLCNLTPAIGVPMMVPIVIGWVMDIRKSAARAA